MEKNNTKKEDRMLKVADVMKILGIGKSAAYNVIRDLGNELESKGYLTISGRIPESYLISRYFTKEEKGDS